MCTRSYMYSGYPKHLKHTPHTHTPHLSIHAHALTLAARYPCAKHFVIPEAKENSTQNASHAAQKIKKHKYESYK